MFETKLSILSKWAFIIWISLSLLGCDSDSPDSIHPQYSTTPTETSKPEYILGIHPLYNPQKLHSVFNPLADYLSRELGDVTIRVEASKDYPSYDEKLRQEKFDLVLPNPFQTINGFAYQYQAIAQMGSKENFRGLILVRKDSHINQIEQLKGTKIAYPAPTALAATMMPQYYLQTHGLNLKTDTETLYVGSQESSIMNTYLKMTQASATWPIPWLDLQKNKPKIANELKIGWQTDPLPNNSFGYHTQKVPEETAKRIQTLLIQLNQHQKGQSLLEKMSIKQIYLANNATYQPIIEFMKKFKAVIGDNHELSDSNGTVK